ncbi:MAG: GvpL/GvpF family gas vesicle protein [Chloroflexi bacterium]|nr:GvpL/GvpF family gas vesicle protein [Chloroflexota bacterium]
MKYFYGIVQPGDFSRPFLKIRDNEIEVFRYKDIAALIGSPLFDSLRDISREELIYQLAEHQVVVEGALSVFPGLIPVKFGTIVSKMEIMEVLEKNLNKFHEIFEKIKGRVEWDLVAVWNDLSSVLSGISESSRTIKNYKEEIASNPYEETFVDRVEIGKMIKDALDKKNEDLAGEFLEKAKDLVEDHRFNPLMDDSMIVNVALLIKKENEEELEERLRDLDEKYEGTITFRLVGPLPPYSFYTVKIKEKEEVEKAKEALGLQEASLSNLKSVYREKARELHPDHSLESQEKFEELTKSYRFLLDYLKDPIHLEGLE